MFQNFLDEIPQDKRVYACEEPFGAICCFVCVGKDKCSHYRMAMDIDSEMIGERATTQLITDILNK